MVYVCVTARVQLFVWRMNFQRKCAAYKCVAYKCAAYKCAAYKCVAYESAAYKCVLYKCATDRCSDITCEVYKCSMCKCSRCEYNTVYKCSQRQPIRRGNRNSFKGFRAMQKRISYYDGLL